jgi:hypothetical protein
MKQSYFKVLCIPIVQKNCLKNSKDIFSVSSVVKNGLLEVTYCFFIFLTGFTEFT